MSFITVAQAENSILKHKGSYGVEMVSFDSAFGRVLAEDIIADRDLPPYDRVTMDGIAISYSAFENGNREFRIRATMAAGDEPVEIHSSEECVELMTGCALPGSTDTVIRYEDVVIKDRIATITADGVKQGTNIHRKGKDKLQGAIVVAANTIVDATVINMAASVGKQMLAVKKLPRVAIISTGDELVDVSEQPHQYQVRRSNSYAIRAVLQQYGVDPVLLHMTDEREAMVGRLQDCFSLYDVIILSGGVSMGKYDFVPHALETLGAVKLFHKVMQRPGKPFWFGRHSGSDTLIFAFPGNPVSAFLCLHRYFVPWLQASSGLASMASKVAALGEDFTFIPQLQYFLQVRVTIDGDGKLVAVPVEGNGSGDFSNLLLANAFMELPAEISNFKKGTVYTIWPFRQIL